MSDGGYFLSLIAAGSWNSRDGEQVWAGGCKATLVSTGVVDIEISPNPVSDDNISCQITQRGTAPVDAYYSVQQVSDSVKRVRFVAGEDSPIDVDFDWLFVRGGQ